MATIAMDGLSRRPVPLELPDDLEEQQHGSSVGHGASSHGTSTTSPSKARRGSGDSTLQKKSRKRINKNFTSILKTISDSLERASSKLPLLEQCYQDLGMLQLMEPVNHDIEQWSLERMKSPDMSTRRSVSFEHLDERRRIIDSGGEKAHHSSERNKAVGFEATTLRGRVPLASPSPFGSSNLLQPPVATGQMMVSMDSIAGGSAPTDIWSVGIGPDEEIPPFQSDARAGSNQSLPTPPAGGGISPAPEVDETTSSTSSESSEADPSEDASCYRLRRHWHRVDMAAIVKYERELLDRQTAMRHTSSLMTPVAEVPKKWLYRREFNLRPSRSWNAFWNDSGSDAGANHRKPLCSSMCRTNCWVCHPQGVQRLFWDMLSILLICYDLVTLPMYAFDFQDTPEIKVWEWCCTIFWTLDIMMSFRTGYYVGHRLEQSPARIARMYMKTWFTIDLAIVIPEWIARTIDWVIEGLNAARIGRISRFVRFVRLFRIVKVGQLSVKIEEILGNSMMLLGFSLMKLSVILCIAVHMISCAWYSLGQSEYGSWVNEETPGEDPLRQYIAAARWALAQINGETDQVHSRTIQEKVFTIACALLTAILMSIFVSTLTTRMMELQKLMDEETRHTKMLMNYLEHKKVSFSVSYLAKMYVRNEKKLKSYKDIEGRLMSILPKSLRADLLFEVRSPILYYHGFFQDLRIEFPDVIRELCSTALDMVQVTAAEHLFEKNAWKDDESSCMYIMERGDLRYAEQDAKLAMALARFKSQEDKSSRTGTRLKGVFDGISSPAMRQMSAPFNCNIDGMVVALPGKAVHHEGTIIAEGALWMQWKTRGELIAISMSMLTQVRAVKFAEIIMSFKETECRAARYARLFQWHITRIRQIRTEQLTDLTVMEAQHIPLIEERINMFVNHAL